MGYCSSYAGEPEALIDPAQITLVKAVGSGSGGAVYKARYNGTETERRLSCIA